MKKILIALIVTACLGPSLWAAGFSKLPMSARAVSFGGSLVSVSDDPNVIFYNPAGIASLRSLIVSTTYVQLFGGIEGDNIRYVTASATANLGLLGQFGFGARTFMADAWKENEFVGTYAQDLFDFFKVGGSVKLLQWSSASPSGLRAVPEAGLSNAVFSFDAGIQSRIANFLPENDLVIGVSLADINKPSIAKSTGPGSFIPPGTTPPDLVEAARLDQRFAAGLSYQSRVYDYLVTIHYVSQGTMKHWGAGAEFTAFKTEILDRPVQFLVRAGGGWAGSITSVIGQGLEQGEVSAGFGLFAGGLQINYAYQYHTVLQYLNGSHFISLQYAF